MFENLCKGAKDLNILKSLKITILNFVVNKRRNFTVILFVKF